MNESATDKMIRELKEENDKLRKMLQSGQLPPSLGDGAVPAAPAEPQVVVVEKIVERIVHVTQVCSYMGERVCECVCVCVCVCLIVCVCVCVCVWESPWVKYVVVHAKMSAGVRGQGRG